MCGRTANTLCRNCICESLRYTLNGRSVTPEWKDLNRGWRYKESFNHSPNQALPVIISMKHLNPSAPVRERVVVLMFWGLRPYWYRGNPKEYRYNTINCRSERLGLTRSFQNAYDNGQRCVFVCEGFFEWERKTTPYFFYVPQKGFVDYKRREWGLDTETIFYKNRQWKGPKLVKMAGLFDICTVNGREFYSFTILTTRSPTAVRRIHKRFPVLLETERDVDKWLNFEDYDTEELRRTLIKPATSIRWYPVSRIVNDKRNDEEICVSPLQEDTSEESDSDSSNSDRRRSSQLSSSRESRGRTRSSSQSSSNSRGRRSRSRSRGMAKRRRYA